MREYVFKHTNQNNNLYTKKVPDHRGAVHFGEKYWQEVRIDPGGSRLRITDYKIWLPIRIWRRKCLKSMDKYEAIWISGRCEEIRNLGSLRSSMWTNHVAEIETSVKPAHAHPTQRILNSNLLRLFVGRWIRWASVRKVNTLVAVYSLFESEREYAWAYEDWWTKLDRNEGEKILWAVHGKTKCTSPGRYTTRCSWLEASPASLFGPKRRVPSAWTWRYCEETRRGRRRACFSANLSGFSRSYEQLLRRYFGLIGCASHQWYTRDRHAELYKNRTDSSLQTSFCLPSYRSFWLDWEHLESLHGKYELIVWSSTCFYKREVFVYTRDETRSTTCLPKYWLGFWAQFRVLKHYKHGNYHIWMCGFYVRVFK